MIGPLRCALGTGIAMCDSGIWSMPQRDMDQYALNGSRTHLGFCLGYDPLYRQHLPSRPLSLL